MKEPPKFSFGQHVSVLCTRPPNVHRRIRHGSLDNASNAMRACGPNKKRFIQNRIILCIIIERIFCASVYGATEESESTEI